MPPEETPQTVEEKVNEERLKQWREKRAKVAEASRTERVRQAEQDRRERLRAIEEERADRAKAASEARARELAAERAERIEAARAKLVGRADIDAARERLLAYRSRAIRGFLLRIGALVVLPTLLVAAYLGAVATPLYRAETIMTVLSAETVQDAAAGETIFTLPKDTRDAFQVRAITLSEPTFRYLDAQHDIGGHFGGDNMDPLRRVRDMSFVQISRLQQYRRFVDMDVRGFEGLMTLTVLARTPDDAEAFSRTIIEHVDAELDLIHVQQLGQQGSRLRIVVPPVASDVPASPDRFAGTLLALFAFSALYGMGSIFFATLRRHAEP